MVGVVDVVEIVGDVVKQDFLFRSVTNNYNNNQWPTAISEISAVWQSPSIKPNTHQQNLLKGISIPLSLQSRLASLSFTPTTTILTLCKWFLFTPNQFSSNISTTQRIKVGKLHIIYNKYGICYLENHQFLQIDKPNHPTLIRQTCTVSLHFSSLSPSSQSTSNATTQSPLPTPTQHHLSKEELRLLS
jgi:hypothetical protein